MFNTHTQATYRLYSEEGKTNFMVRIVQLFQMRRFIEKCLMSQKIYESDLILMMGDFNIDARDTMIPKSLLNPNSYVWKGFMTSDDFDSVPEIEIMSHLLSGNGKDTIVHLSKDDNNQFPITYGKFFGVF